MYSVRERIILVFILIDGDLRITENDSELSDRKSRMTATVHIMILFQQHHRLLMLGQYILNPFHKLVNLGVYAAPG